MAEPVLADSMGTNWCTKSSVIFRASYKLAERLGKDPGANPPAAVAVLVGVPSWQLAPVRLQCSGSNVAMQ